MSQSERATVPSLYSKFFYYWAMLRAQKVLIFLCLTFFSYLFVLSPQTAFSIEHTSVIYPDLSGPYKNVFESILQGIAAQTDGKIHAYPVNGDFNLEALQQALAQNQSDGIITLSKRGYLTAQQLDTELPVAVGALSIVPNGISGISLAADPDKLFAKLKALLPKIDRVFVVYSEKSSGWLIPLAELAAQKHKLQLSTHRAENLREAMHHYRNLLQESKSDTDAIWLPLDKVTVNDDVVLPMLLQKAWDKQLAIISNRPGHAKRGVLFSVYPDNYGMGKELAKLLKKLKKTPERPIVIPLNKLQLGANLRTASHLGITFTPRQLENFTLTFPSR